MSAEEKQIERNSRRWRCGDVEQGQRSPPSTRSPCRRPSTSCRRGRRSSGRGPSLRRRAGRTAAARRRRSGGRSRAAGSGGAAPSSSCGSRRLSSAPMPTSYISALARSNSLRRSASACSRMRPTSCAELLQLGVVGQLLAELDLRAGRGALAAAEMQAPAARRPRLDSSRSCSTRCACASRRGAVALDALVGRRRAPAAPSGRRRRPAACASRCRRCASSSSWRCVAGAGLLRAARRRCRACACWSAISFSCCSRFQKSSISARVRTRSDLSKLEQALAEQQRSPGRRASRRAPSAGAGSRAPASARSWSMHQAVEGGARDHRVVGVERRCSS